MNVNFCGWVPLIGIFLFFCVAFSNGSPQKKHHSITIHEDSEKEFGRQIAEAIKKSNILLANLVKQVKASLLFKYNGEFPVKSLSKYMEKEEIKYIEEEMSSIVPKANELLTNLRNNKLHFEMSKNIRSAQFVLVHEARLSKDSLLGVLKEEFKKINFVVNEEQTQPPDCLAEAENTFHNLFKGKCAIDYFERKEVFQNYIFYSLLFVKMRNHIKMQYEQLLEKIRKFLPSTEIIKSILKAFKLLKNIDDFPLLFKQYFVVKSNKLINRLQKEMEKLSSSEKALIENLNAFGFIKELGNLTLEAEDIEKVYLDIIEIQLNKKKFAAPKGEVHRQIENAFENLFLLKEYENLMNEVSSYEFVTNAYELYKHNEMKKEKAENYECLKALDNAFGFEHKDIGKEYRKNYEEVKSHMETYKEQEERGKSKIGESSSYNEEVEKMDWEDSEESSFDEIKINGEEAKEQQESDG